MKRIFTIIAFVLGISSFSNAQIDLPITWDDTANVNYTVTDFDGTSSTLTVDPLNSSNLVLKTTRNTAGQIWQGTTLSTPSGLASPIPFTATSQVIKALVYSPDSGITINLKVENSANGGINSEVTTVTSIANAWDTLTFDFSNATNPIVTSNTYDKVSIFYDFLNTPTSVKDYYLDDVFFSPVTNPAPVVAQIDLPITWDDTANVNYTVTDFDGTSSMLTTDPLNASNIVLQTRRDTLGQPWQGTTLSTPIGLATAIPFSASATSISCVILAPDSGITIRLKVEDAANGGIYSEVDVTTNVANAWDTLTFDFANATVPLNFANTYNKVTIFYDFFGSPTNVNFYYLDNLIFNPSPFNPFSLLSPADGSTLLLNGNVNSTTTATWNSAGNGFNYTWMANLPNGGFSPALLSFPSNNNGNDTTITFSYSTLNSLLGNFGVNIGDTAELEWTVKVSGGNDSAYSVDTFSISLVRGVTLTPAILTSPANNTNIQVAGPSTNFATATWKSSGDTVTNYIWQYDNSFGNFNNPKLSISVQDTFINLSFDTLRDLLVSQAIPVNGLFVGKWRVRAQANGLTVNSSSRNLNLTRLTVVDPFDLIAPANNSSLTVSGDGNNTVTINWENAGFGVSYNWYLLNPINGDTVITIPTALNNDSLVLTYDAIDRLLEDNGIPVGATVPFNWTVSAMSSNGNLSASNGPFSVNLTRGSVIRIFNYTSPSNGATVNLFGDETKNLEATWENSGSGITYVWQLDSASNNFSNPLLSVPTSADTFVSLPYSAVENLLASLGVNIGETINLKWRVYASNGTDTVYNPSYNLNIDRNPLIRAFDLVSPATGASLTIEGAFDNIAMPSWESSSNTTPTYQWLFDTLGGNFSNPLLTLNSDSSGNDSSISLSYGLIDGFLEANGIGKNGTFSGIWTVRVVEQTDTILASSVNTIDLIRGSVVYPFNLNSPGNNAGLTVEGVNTDLITPTWHPSNDTLVTYGFYLDTIGGGFASPLVYASAGSDTSVSFTMDVLSQLLISLNVPYNSFKTFEWFIEAYAGGDTLASLDTFKVSLSRGTVLNPFSQISPNNGLFLNVEGDGKQTVNITWHDASPDGLPVYDWLLDVPSGNFSAPIASVVSNGNGADTSLTLSYNQIDGLLANLGLSVGDTITAIWSARANGGFKTLLATNNPYIITFVRGQVIRPFDLITPPDGTILNVTGDGNKNAEISWNVAGIGNLSYEWFLDVPGGNFSNPIVSLPSNNSGSDTTLSIDFPTLENLLITNGLNIGDTLKAIWDVKASNSAGDAFSVNGPYNIWVIRGSVITDFNLTSPANNTRLVVQGDATTPVSIEWTSAGNGNYSYEWLLDLPGGNFSPPIASLQSDNNGSDEMLSLDFDAISGLLGSLGVNLGDSVAAIWTVRANEGNDVVQSQDIFNIKLVRGALTLPFDLVGPVDGTILSISGNSAQSLNISWQNADYLGKTGSLNYEWLLDVPTGNFNNPVTSMMSDNSGKATSLTLPYNDIYGLLNANGLAIGDEIELKWTVKASLLQLEEFAQSEFDIKFIKNENVGLSELNKTTFLKAYPNPSNGSFMLELDAFENGNAIVELMDVIGKTVVSETRKMVDGKNLMIFNVDAPAGFYIVRVKTPTEIIETRITIAK